MIVLGVICLIPLALMAGWAIYVIVRVCITHPAFALLLLGSLAFVALTAAGISILASYGIGGHA